MKKKFLIFLLLLCLMAGCGSDGEEATQATPMPTPKQAAVVQTDVYADYMAEIEAQSDAVEKSLMEAMTQMEMNMISNELYELWDGALNELWGELEKALPEGDFAALTQEQLRWIEDKEAAVREAGSPYEGGSIYPMIVNSEAARITEERVYELYDLLKE